MGTMFFVKMALTESVGFEKLRASVNSLSSSFAQKTKIGLLVKRTLQKNHVIPKVGQFPEINLTSFYNKSSLMGDSAFSQMCIFLMKIFKQIREKSNHLHFILVQILSPRYNIWIYSFRPKCVRSVDKHFISFPEAIAEGLESFAYDAIGIHLPDHLLHGDVDLNDPFVNSLNTSEKSKEVNRRRNERDNVSQTMQQSIGHMLLERHDCVIHLSWKDVKDYRATCRTNGTDPDDFVPKDLIGFSKRAGTAKNAEKRSITKNRSAQ
uniref:ULP_PROTEASE domain-containing protein n=1 Tax=Caenorhabditis tropicalis TaxID=1561998 RepID=A0A1I7UK62_9PELO